MRWLKIQKRECLENGTQLNNNIKKSFKVTSAAKPQLLKMCHLMLRLRICLSRKKVVFRYRDIQVFVFLTIP